MKWIKVEDKLPKAGQDVLVWCGWCQSAGYKQARRRKKGNGFLWATEDGMNPIFHVTHWMPSPNRPRDLGDKT